MRKNPLFKFLALALIACLVLSICLLVGCNKEENNDFEQKENQNEVQVAEKKAYEKDVEPISVGIISDLHIVDDYFASELFFDETRYTAYRVMKTIYELSFPLLKCAVDKYIEQKPDVVLVLGDILEFGFKSVHQMVANELMRLEAAGIPVFVMNGLTDLDKYYSFKIINFDYQLTLPHEFSSIYNDFGFGEALSATNVEDEPETTLSYTADIPGTNYRIISLDTASLYQRENEIVEQTEAKPISATKAQLAWLENALWYAQKRNKNVIVMSNLPLSEIVNPNYMTAFFAGKYTYVKNGKAIQKLLAKYGVTYVFTGHTHTESNIEVLTDNGTIVEDYTASLTGYPGMVKTFTINANNTFSTKKDAVEKIPTEYLPGFIPTEEKTAVTTDMKTYYKTRLVQDIRTHYTQSMENKEDGDNLMIYFFKKLELYEGGSGEHDAELEALGEDVLNWMRNVNKMPLYGENSIADFASDYNMEMPVISAYSNHNVLDFVGEIAFAMYDGTFVNAKGSDTFKIFSCIFYAGLHEFGSIDLLNRLHDVNDLIRGCDIAGLIEETCQTGVANLQHDEFLFSMVTMLYPYLQHSLGIYLTFESTADLLAGINGLLPILSMAIPDMHLFITDEDIQNQRTSYADLKNGIIYGEELLYEILFPVIARSVINN